MNKISVLVVDDSAVVRESMKKIIESDSDLALQATAQNPYVAVEKIKQAVPDVMVLDIEMPKMDGVTFLKKIMSQRPIPVLICSSLAACGSETYDEVMRAGAVDVILKPNMSTKAFYEESRIQIIDAIKAVSKARPQKRVSAAPTQESHSADAVMARPKRTAMAETTEKIIAIGSSTGGTEAVAQLLREMPMDCPGILVTQHMPEGFTQKFAQRLNKELPLVVKEARDGDTVIRGQVLIAPGGMHMLLQRSGARYYVQVKEGPLVSRHRPSVDVLFRSVAKYAGKNATAAILTGMGKDGAEGMKEIFETGATTYAQDEASCVVYGMPKEAVALGGVSQVIPLDRMTRCLLKSSGG